MPIAEREPIHGLKSGKLSTFNKLYKMYPPNPLGRSLAYRETAGNGGIPSSGMLH